MFRDKKIKLLVIEYWNILPNNENCQTLFSPGSTDRGRINGIGSFHT